MILHDEQLAAGSFHMRLIQKYFFQSQQSDCHLFLDETFTLSTIFSFLML